jgi:hypothetical protein
MGDNLTADEIRTLLNLSPHVTYGFVRSTYQSNRSVATGGYRIDLSGAICRSAISGETR